MTATLILPGVYQPDGSALVIAGQPAGLVLSLTRPNPIGAGPETPQDLTGRAFVQRILHTDGSVAAEAAGHNAPGGEVEFHFSSATITGILGSLSSLDLTHAIVELVTDGEDLVLMRPFSVRTAAAGAPRAAFTLNTGSPDGLMVRYAGAPGPAGRDGASSAAEVAYDDNATMFGVSTLQEALEFIGRIMGFPAGVDFPSFDFSRAGNFAVGMVMGVI